MNQSMQVRRFRIARAIAAAIATLGITALGCQPNTRTAPGGPIAGEPGSTPGVPATVNPAAARAAGAGANGTRPQTAPDPAAGPAGGMTPPGATQAGSAAAPRTAPMPPPADGDELDAGAPAEPARRLPIFETNGEPLKGTPGAWTLIEFPDTQCRDGSPAGVFLNLGTAKKLMIYLEGGGKCADKQTCDALNPASISGGELIRSVARAGILDRSKPENPVRDWNIAYIPYCTGDRHGGANPDGNVPSVGPQKFVGYTNMKKLLNRIVPTFRDATDVLLTGISAGGFGVAYTGVLVQRAFPNVKVKAIIDSAPFVSTAVFTECDQQKTRELYKAEQTFLGECGSACPKPNDYWRDYGLFFAKVFADRPWGLISTSEDLVERAFFGIGARDCTAPLDLVTPGISADAYRNDLLDLRAALASYPSFATFYPDAETHTFLGFEEFYTVKAGNMRLVDWFASIVNEESPGHAGP